MTLNDAIALVKKDIEAGHAMRYSTENGALYVESNQGWSKFWPLDHVTYMGSNDSLD